MDYAPETPARVHQFAALAAARHFGTEAVRTTPIAQDRTDQVLAHEVVGQHPKYGYALLGRSVVVTVADDGSAEVSDED